MICQLVLEYFQLQLSDILFFLEAFGLFGIFWPSKGLTAFLRPKNPKKASGLQKKPNVFKLQLKILQKKLTHHEKMPAFFLSLVPYHIDAHSSMILYINCKCDKHDNFCQPILTNGGFISFLNQLRLKMECILEAVKYLYF